MAVAFTATLGTAVSAQAAEPSFWVKCDGLPKPESLGLQTAKAGITILTGGLYALAIEEGGQPLAGAAGVAACSQVLADPALDPFWARRVSLLRSRAMHNVEAGDLDAGLKDLEATRLASEGHVDDVAFNRSLGVSTKLFEAALLAKRGRGAEAERLAMEAANARPYSARIQTLAAAIFAIDPALAPDEDRLLSRRASLQPDGLMARALAREWGDLNGAADDWSMIVEDIRRLKPDGQFIVESMEYGEGSAVQLPLPLAKAALASARAGRVTEARALLDELEKLQPWAPAIVPKNKYQAQRTQSIALLSKSAIERAMRYKPLISAWLLAQEGRHADAIATLGEQFPAEPASFELLAWSRKELGKDMASVEQSKQAFLGNLRSDRTEQLEVLKYAQALPLLEAIQKGKQRPGKPMSGLDGRDWSIKSGGRGISVDGYKGIAVAEEMALLRAAQFSRTNGADRFLITERRDFERYYVSAYAPRVAPNNPNPQSVQTVSEITLLAAGAPAQKVGAARERLAVNAEEVWASLAPVYLEDAPAR